VLGDDQPQHRVTEEREPVVIRRRRVLVGVRRVREGALEQRRIAETVAEPPLEPGDRVGVHLPDVGAKGQRGVRAAKAEGVRQGHLDILLASLVAGSKDPSAYAISKDAFSKPEPYGIMLRKEKYINNVVFTHESSTITLA